MNPQNPFEQQYPPQPQPAVVPEAPAPVQPAQPTPMGMPAPTPPQQMTPPAQSPKSSKKWVILTFVFIFTTLAAVGLAGWAVYTYNELKINTDSAKADAVSLAVKEQKELDADAYAKAEKEPNALFVGPDDYGRLTFKYPKTWGVYEVDDATDGGDYEAIFNPGVIPPMNKDQRYALRLTIADEIYEDVLNDYASRVKSGELTSSSVTLGEQNGTRFDGNFSEDIRGSAVVLKIRDKTVIMQTDAETFTDDFNALIATITFNK